MTARKTTRIDMHVHTMGSDGISDARSIAKAAKKAGLDGICITDHHKTYTAENLLVAQACREIGLLVFHGCEYSTAQGHLLIYGVNAEDLQLGFYPDMQEVIVEVYNRGGVAVPAHPYKGYKKSLKDAVKSLKYVRAYEVANGQVAVQEPGLNIKAGEAAKECKKLGLGGSDAHWASNVGIAYTEFQAVITCERDFVKALRYGQFRAITSQKRVKTKRSKYQQKQARLATLPLPKSLSSFTFNPTEEDDYYRADYTVSFDDGDFLPGWDFTDRKRRRKNKWERGGS